MANVDHRKEKTSLKSTKEKRVSKTHHLPVWIVVWFYITAVICTWDASFIMCRPYSMPGQSMAWIWYFYKYYVTVDQRYSDIGDAYVYAQSLLNYAEVVLNIIAIVMHYRQSKHTIPTAFMVNVMTMWKTVLYFLMFSDLCTGSEYRRGNTLFQEVFIMVIPNIVWIFVPTAAMVQLWGHITPGEENQNINLQINGETKQNGYISHLTRHYKVPKREIVRGPGSGLLQGASTTGDMLVKSQSLSLTSCLRQRAASVESTNSKN